MSIITKLHRLLVMNAAIFISTKPSLSEKPQEYLPEQVNQATYQSQYLHASHADMLTQNSYQKKKNISKDTAYKSYSGLQEEIY